jgi:hypothetical protein
LFLLEDFLLLLHDAASHGEGSGFFQNVVLWLTCDIASYPRRMESSATPLKKTMKLALFFRNWSKTVHLAEQPGSIIFFPSYMEYVHCSLLIHCSVIVIVLIFLDCPRCSGKTLYVSGARCHLATFRSWQLCLWRELLVAII